MGGSERGQEEEDALREVAQGILVEAGVANQCEYCDDVTGEYVDDLTAAYKIAAHRVKAGKIELPAGWVQTDFTDLIKEEHTGLPMECHCQHQMNKDD